MLDLLLPADVSLPIAALLVGTSFVTSMMTGALGLGGGVMMLALVASVLPAAVVIPVHGVVQIGSNFGRSVVMRREVEWQRVLRFAAGSLLGVLAGAMVATELPRGVLLTLLGLFVLWSCWSPKLKPHNVPMNAFLGVGAVTSFVTMFLGATGPFVAAFLSPEKLGRKGVVATHAASMTIQHSFKVGAFTALGFAFMPWLPLTLAMVALGFLGTLMGTRMLDRMADRNFATAFRVVLTLLALQLVWQGVSALLA